MTATAAGGTHPTGIHSCEERDLISELGLGFCLIFVGNGISETSDQFFIEGRNKSR